MRINPALKTFMVFIGIVMVVGGLITLFVFPRMLLQTECVDFDVTITRDYGADPNIYDVVVTQGTGCGIPIMSISTSDLGTKVDIVLLQNDEPVYMFTTKTGWTYYNPIDFSQQIIHITALYTVPIGNYTATFTSYNAGGICNPMPDWLGGGCNWIKDDMVTGALKVSETEVTFVEIA